MTGPIQPPLFGTTAHAPKLTRCQVFTPLDGAIALWNRFMGDLTPGTRIVEPTCGTGNLLRAIPANMNAVGVEIDPELAAAARRLVADDRGWPILQGDFEEIQLPWPRAEAMFGNPPWEKAVIDRLLDWAHGKLENEGRIGLLLPAMYTQYAAQGCRLAERWSIESVEIPHDLFFPAHLQETVSFKLFTKHNGLRTMTGMFLYPEVAARRAVDPRYQAMLRDNPGTWREIVRTALARLGGNARLSELYAEVAHRNRRESNNHWREKIRQILQKSPEFVRIGDGHWALAA